MVEAPPRVAVLARPGEASERLQEAVRSAGAQLLGAFDPLRSAAADVAGFAPQALVVALEPAIEDALEGFGPLLSDPAVAVIFDEAELAVQRAGWDAARWGRHLAAKLYRHDDVLPPRGQGGTSPSPPVASPAAAPAGEADPASAAEGAGVPAAAAAPARDPGHASGWQATAVPGAPGEPDAPSQAGAAPAFALDAPVDVAPDAPGLEAADPDAMDLDVVGLDVVGLEAVGLDEAIGGAPAGDAETAPFDGDFGGLALDGISLDDLALDATGDDGAPRAPAAPRTYLEPIDLQWPAQDDPPAAADAAAPAPWEAGAAAASQARQAPAGPLPAAGDDGAPARGADADRFADLESRISGLSLVDMDSYGFGPPQGAVLIEGGLGGPDPVRQLLAAIPDDFPRALLVRLRLDGGRYDRLVRQMARATMLPVSLAEAGGSVERGTVYFLPPGLGVEQEQGRLRFVDEPVAGIGLPAALSPEESAVVFLSGADVGLVDLAMAPPWSAALVVGQALDGCYDATAAAAVAERGGALAAPADLAALLAQRWAPAAVPAGIELETRDE